jgi:hypothetical protein
MFADVFFVEAPLAFLSSYIASITIMSGQTCQASCKHPSSLTTMPGQTCSRLASFLWCRLSFVYCKNYICYCDVEDCLIFRPVGFFGWKLTI